MYPCFGQPGQRNNHFFRNWKLPEKRMSKDCFSLSEVSYLTESCKAIFDASIGEIFLLSPRMDLDEPRKEKMFVSRRLDNYEDTCLAEDLICTGCQICGCPLGLESGYEKYPAFYIISLATIIIMISEHYLLFIAFRPVVDQNSVPLYCPKSLNRLHVVSMIYKPFMVWMTILALSSCSRLYFTFLY